MKVDKNLIKGIIMIAAVIILTAGIARFLSGSETLSEYAAKHPKTKVEPEIEVIDDTVTPEVTAQVMENEEVSNEESERDSATDTEDATGKDTDTKTDDYKGSSAMNDEYFGTDECVIYDEGFYYEPIPQVIRDKMKGLSYPEDIDESKISFDDLRYVRLRYVDFEGETQEGEMVCNKAIAQDVTEIFHELYRQDYRIESIKLIDDFDADDNASMAADNTSCFCYRVVEGTTRLSNHAYGRAIDINPFYNPYIVFKKGGDDHISPPGSEIYADRSANFPYKIDENDLAYKLFTEHGFTWGGNWNNSKDYQHFEKKE